MQIQKLFPIFENSFMPKGVIYFDNAATTLKSIYTINRVSRFYTYETSSIARGTNALVEKNTLNYEETRRQFASFINASPEEIVFTNNCTDAINLVARGLEAKKHHKTVVSILEHHSNYLPWKNKGPISVLSVTDDGIIDINDLEKHLKEKTEIVATSYVSNVTGNIQPVHEIVRIAKQYGAMSLIDAAQAASHIPIDVKKIDCDFMTFSAHKMFGPSGVGILYGKKESLSLIQPKNHGGGMVDKVHPSVTSYKEYPYILEAGTPNIEGVLGLQGALDFFKKFPFSTISPLLHSLKTHLVNELKKLPFIDLPFPISSNHIPIVCFRPKSSIDIEYLATVLSDSHNIYLRAGYHCAQPLFHSYNIPGALRISLHAYNTIDEIDTCIDVLKKLKPLLQ